MSAANAKQPSASTSIRPCFCNGALNDFSQHYKQCASCGTFISQHPAPANLAKFYGFWEYWHVHQIELKAPTIEHRIANDLNDGRCSVAIKFLGDIGEGKNILEIGCAPGLLLSLFAKCGHNCYGIEPHPDTVAWIRRRHNLQNVYSGVFPDCFVAQGFDVVLAMDVLEHSFDPSAFFRKVNYALVNGGLFLVQTPIYRTAQWRGVKPWGAHHERLFLEQEHIYLLSAKGMRWLANFAGFEIIKEGRWALCHDLTLLQKRRQV